MKKRTFIAGALIAAAIPAGIAIATSSSEPAISEDIPPIVQQVEEHETRIGELEVQADQTQQQVDSNTERIRVVETRVDVVEQTVATPAPSAPQEPAPAPVEQPTPEPAPEPHPRTIIAVSDEPDPYTANSHICTYTLHDPRESSIQGSVTQPLTKPCLSVGEVLPR